MREKIEETATATIVGCDEIEPPMAKPANHDPSVRTAVVVVPDPDPATIPDSAPASDAEPYVISPDPLDVELELEPIGSNPAPPGVVAVVEVLTGVASLDDF